MARQPQARTAVDAVDGHSGQNQAPKPQDNQQCTQLSSIPEPGPRSGGGVPRARLGVRHHLWLTDKTLAYSEMTPRMWKLDADKR